MNFDKKYYYSKGLHSVSPVSGAADALKYFPYAAEKIRRADRIVKISCIVAVGALSLLVGLFFARPSSFNVAEKNIPSITESRNLSVFKVASAKDLLVKLRGANLWEIGGSVPPVVLANMPDDLDKLDVDTKKRAFINSLLPISLIALGEIEQEKFVLESILAKLPNSDDNLIFDDETTWPHGVSDTEIEVLEHLTRKYRTTSKEKLLNRVDVLPVSLILAQGAIESSWGSSRFCLEGNNLFGVWTWGEKGMTPKEREKGASHKVAVYESLLESVRAYLLMLNRLPAYADLRDMRNRSGSSLELADGLLYYSQRRDSYINDLKQVIVVNNLQQFDGKALSVDTGANESEAVKLVQLDVAKNPKM